MIHTVDDTYNIHICIAHYNEDLIWTKYLNTPFSIISKHGIEYDVAPNRGNEASSYLKYIIDNYEQLPDFVFFVHGHETSNHQTGKIQDIINTTINIITDSTRYLDINGCQLNLRNFPTSYTKFLEFIPIYNSIIKKKQLTENDIIYWASAQFCVNKDAILSNSKEVYENFYNYLMTTNENSFWTSRYFEYTWEHIFSY